MGSWCVACHCPREDATVSLSLGQYLSLLLSLPVLCPSHWQLAQTPCLYSTMYAGNGKGGEGPEGPALPPGLCRTWALSPSVSVTAVYSMVQVYPKSGWKSLVQCANIGTCFSHSSNWHTLSSLHPGPLSSAVSAPKRAWMYSTTQPLCSSLLAQVRYTVPSIRAPEALKPHPRISSSIDFTPLLFIIDLAHPSPNIDEYHQNE